MRQSCRFSRWRDRATVFARPALRRSGDGGGVTGALGQRGAPVGIRPGSTTRRTGTKPAAAVDPGSERDCGHGTASAVLIHPIRNPYMSAAEACWGKAKARASRNRAEAGEDRAEAEQRTGLRTEGEAVSTPLNLDLPCAGDGTEERTSGQAWCTTCGLPAVPPHAMKSFRMLRLDVVRIKVLDCGGERLGQPADRPSRLLKNYFRRPRCLEKRPNSAEFDQRRTCGLPDVGFCINLLVLQHREGVATTSLWDKLNREG